MAIGHILRNARIAKQLTASQVAEMTRMKVQIVQDLEKDDFHRIAATIYGKGFIKLYAECVGLDPQPLINDYLQSVVGEQQQPIPKGVHMKRHKSAPAKTEDPPDISPDSDTLEKEHDDSEKTSGDDLFSYSKRKNTIEDESLRITDEDRTKPEESSSAGSLKKRLEDTVRVVSEQAKSFTGKLADRQWGDRPLKIAAGIVVVLILVLVISITTRSCGRESVVSGDDSSLNLPTPPEPYFD